MALPGSGAISLSEIQTEFTGSNPISISEYYRGVGVTDNNTGVPTSGAISLANFYGAVRQFAFTSGAELIEPSNLRTMAIAAGWDESAPVVFTNTGIISSNSTGVAALTVNGSFPGGVSLINTGYIVGRGGNGNGGVGGVALTASVAISIDNSGTVAGGGGGGGYGTPGGTGGNLGGYGGGGGGRTGLTASSGGAGQGGVVFPGSAGAGGNFNGGGAGGSAGYPPYGGGGGAGGTWGATGATGINGSDPVWNSPQAGAAGGAAVSGNSYVTWVATGTRYGSLA